MSAPGIFFEMTLCSRGSRRGPRRRPPTVAPFASGICSEASRRTSATVPPAAARDTPSIPATCPIATWMPTPVRKPISTLRDRKSARNPSLTQPGEEQERRRSGSRPHPGERDVLRTRRSVAIPASPAAMIAAVAESAPTTRCRDDPSSANTAIGTRIVYRPGDHRHPGDLRVAHDLGDAERRERDARDDVGRDPRRSSGRIPCITGSRCPAVFVLAATPPPPSPVAAEHDAPTLVAHHPDRRKAEGAPLGARVSAP